MQIATAEQMRGMDRRAMEEAGLPSLVLMERAAQGLAEAALGLCQDMCRNGEAKARDLNAGENGIRKWRAAVFCGSGNNGGDGVAAARLLMEQDFEIRAFLVGRRERMTEDCQEMERRLLAAGGCLEDFQPGNKGQRAWCMDADILVDAIFGIGLNKEVQGDAAEAIAWINEGTGLAVSADIASGIEADTGRVLGSAVKAAVTVAFTYPKAGHFVGKGALHTGELRVHSIGIPERFCRISPTLEVLTAREAARLLPQRPEDGHKGTFGKVYVLGGSVGLTGAPIFSASGAVRSGSGLVFVGVPRQVYAITAGKSQEAMVHPLPCDQEGRLTMEALWGVSNRAEQCDAVLLGPGLGRSRDVERLIEKLLLRIPAPLVLDADGLYAVRNRKETLKERARRGWMTILTPHDGEFAYLGGDLSGQQRLRQARQFAEEYGCILVLKGHGTLIAAPDGRAFVNVTGNCGMAKGGSGDILSGMILSFVGQGMEPFLASALAVWIHGRAGDLCARELSVYAMRPTDLLERLPYVFLELLSEKG